MKNSILKFALLLFTFFLIIGCSTEKEEILEQELITANSFNDQISLCINPFLETRRYCIEYIYIEYELGLTIQEKQAIRAPYCGNMIAVEVCHNNPNAEIWTVRGNYMCNEEPVLLPPADPDLRHSVRSGSNECQAQ